MKRYYLYYYVDDDKVRGFNSTFMSLNFDLTEKTIKRVEFKMKKVLDVKKLTIVSYRKVQG